MNAEMMSRARFVLAAALVLSSSQAQAQTWPARPLEFTVPFTAGGSADIIGHAVANGMAAELGQSAVIVNREGAGGTGACARTRPPISHRQTTGA